MGKKSNYITIPLPLDTWPTHPGGGIVASAVPDRKGVEISRLFLFVLGPSGMGHFLELLLQRPLSQLLK